MKIGIGLAKTTMIVIIAYVLILIVLGISYHFVQLLGISMSMTSSGIVQTVPFIIITWFIWKYIGYKKWSIGFKEKYWKKELCIGLIVGFCLMSLIVLLILTADDVSIRYYMVNKEVLLSLVPLFFLFLMVGFSEELFSRGLIMGAAKYYAGKWFAIAFSAIGFSLLHAGNNHFSFGLPFINLILAGLMFALFREWRGSIWLAVGLHITWNFFQGPVYGFRVSGISLPSIITIDYMSYGSPYINGGEFGPEGSMITSVILVSVSCYLLYKLVQKES
ncbi:CPBP family intramembrane glutamic endopeptidase [Anaerobacillus sp. MEB173]|uniref:CPBP family intramembrane glutamic endopeptidase n=1 Tax=Anaerobacillus sp. MEB173 TaxID=3383345 RepID=UPI003F8E8C40